MPNTKAAGDITEAVVLAEFLRAGFPVCVPFGDNQRYDLVVEAGGRFLRVQCKTASLTSDRCGGKGCIRFKARSGVHESRPYRGQADLFAAYSPDTRRIYVLAVDEVPGYRRLAAADARQKQQPVWDPPGRGPHPRGLGGPAVLGVIPVRAESRETLMSRFHRQPARRSWSRG